MSTSPQAQRSTSQRTRKTGRRVDRRELLLQAGVELFAERPYEQVSASEVATRAGVAHGLLFHYFGSKRQFFVVLLEREAAESQRLFDANTDPDPARWARKEIRTFLSGVEGDNNIFASMIHGSVSAEADVHRIVAGMQSAAAERFLWKLQPTKRSELLLNALSAWVASANELGVQWLESGRSMPKRQLERLLVSSLNATLRAVAAVDHSAEFDAARFAPE